VASGFFRKLLGSPAVPAHLTDQLAELDQLAKSQPARAEVCTVLKAVLPALFAEPAAETAPPMTLDQARAKLQQGIPLLRGETVDFDEAALLRRWRAVAAAVGKQHSGDAARAVADAVAELDPPALVAEALAGRPHAVGARAEALGVDSGLTAATLRLSVYPALAHLAEQLAPLCQGAAWDAAYCPTCGNFPTLAEFRGLEQVRLLRCLMCASAWEFPRLRCPYCDNRDHRTLGYLHAEGEQDRYRAATCDQCRGYVKVVATLTPPSPVQLLVLEVATLHLDFAAGDRGYLVP
jgi:FdhE protein